ncbi:MAG TPA: toxin-antitoxin system YwqK family antitoxin [Planctomycetota bacterium]|nr:toxin-antitoxin system YwqK family antitoxin [Planctomycetota bacterium]
MSANSLRLLLTASAILLLTALSVIAGEDPYFTHEVTSDYQRQRTVKKRDGGSTVYHQHKTDASLAIQEQYTKEGKLIQRNFLKDQVPHGVSRRWYPDGKHLAESHYSAGQMHGVFKEWDESGKLVANYAMENGTGVRKMFHSNGAICEETRFNEGKMHGVSRGYYDTGQIQFFNRYDNGKLNGASLAWLADGTPMGFGSYNENGKLHGVTFDLMTRDAAGKPIINVILFVNGLEVDRAAYEESAKSDPALHKLEAKPENYLLLFEQALQKNAADIGPLVRNERGP